jgi:hypothetical protein
MPPRGTSRVRSVLRYLFREISNNNNDFYVIRDRCAFAISGGLKYGLKRQQTVYIARRGVLGHDLRRYYQLVALQEEIDKQI